VGELVAGIEVAVDDHQRDVVGPLGQSERAVELVVDDPHPGEAAPDVRGRPLEAVVVVPLEGGALGLAVLHQLVAVGAAIAGGDQEVVA
jgi:hypothetical protein